jgi:Ca2+-binding RTX toxin-like protein
MDTLVVNAAAETQSMFLAVGGSPTFAVNSTSGNFDVDAYNVEKVKFTGGTGADTIDTGRGGVTVNGGGGAAVDHWLADLSQLTTDVAFELGVTTSIVAAGLTSILNIEQITLTTGKGDDTITGGVQADLIHTGAGDDVINAKTRPVAGGIDVVNGGAGLDTLVVDASGENQTMFLSVGLSPTFAVNSNSGRFDVDAYAVERAIFTGGSVGDEISGNNWNDVLSGGGGADFLGGNGGDDTLDGGVGADFLRGGRGADQLTGGAAADTFDYDAVGDSSVLANKLDTVVDFVSGVDKFDLSGIDADARGVNGDTAFAFIGAAAFALGVRGQLRSAGGLIEADLNGDTVADFRINVNAAAVVGDFIL